MKPAKMRARFLFWMVQVGMYFCICFRINEIYILRAPPATTVAITIGSWIHGCFVAVVFQMLSFVFSSDARHDYKIVAGPMTILCSVFEVMNCLNLCLLTEFIHKLEQNFPMHGTEWMLGMGILLEAICAAWDTIRIFPIIKRMHVQHGD